MPDPSYIPPQDSRLEERLPDSVQDLVSRVQAGQARMLRARATRENAYWRALTLLGVVGWSVTIPTLAGVALGIWIDRVLPSRFSWTLTFLFIGLAIGCLNAWIHIKNDPKG